MTFQRPNARVLLGLILLVALALRCLNIGFGLPAMYDPDEPLFVIKAYELLDKGSLNPGWFGHPGSTTIYLLAIVDLLVLLVGMLLGAYSTVQEFAAAVYADPGVIFIPSRLAFVLIGTAVVLLTYLVARALFDTSTALLAAALLALNSLHIAWSQVIRTDVQASLFMLLSLLFSIKAAGSGRLKDFVLAGLFVGVAMATKWPGGAIIIAAAGAALHLARRTGNLGRAPAQLATVVAAALVGLFLASPFVFLDWRTVLDNVSGEVAGGHLGHSGRGLFGNLVYYLREELAGSMGWLGLALAIAGLVAAAGDRVARFTLLPAALLFLWMISAQAQIWSRWLIPALPMLAIAAAFAITRAAQWVEARGRRGSRLVLPVMGAVALLPSAAAAAGGARERSNDTRDMASAWARANIPPGSTIIVEHLALDLRGPRWRILFPLGAAGCIDGEQALAGGVQYDKVQKSRKGRPIVDLGNVAPERLGSCRADYAILTYYDLYVREMDRYPEEVATYRRFIGNGRTLALFSPERGQSGGPPARVVALGQQVSPNRSRATIDLIR